VLIRLTALSRQSPRESWTAPSLALIPQRLSFLELLPIFKPELSGTYDQFPRHIANGRLLTKTQHLPPHKDRHSIRRLARSQVASRLGRPFQGPQMGEPAHGLAIQRRRHAGHPS
jgi:hypothetical protein